MWQEHEHPSRNTSRISTWNSMKTSGRTSEVINMTVETRSLVLEIYSNSASLMKTMSDFVMFCSRDGDRR